MPTVIGLRMKSVIYLKKDAVYFYAAFLDEDLTIPSIETWIYKGLDPKDGHLFEDASDEKKQYCFPEGIKSDILDHKALSGWLLEKHSPKKVGKEYEYKNL